MKTSFKRLLFRLGALTLAILMLFSVVACSKEENQEDDSAAVTDGDTEEGELQPVFSGKTYGYADFNILTRGNSESEYYKDMGVDQLTSSSTEVDKAVYTRNKKVEEQFQINLMFLGTDSDNKLAQQVNTVAQAGEADTYDVIISHGRSAFSGAINGYYLDWNDLEWVNLDATWWSQSAREEWTTSDGALYVMNGDISYLSIGSASCMYFNRDVFESSSGLTSPYDYVAEENWTLATFKQSVIDADNTMNGDGSGDPATDTFGYGTEAWRGPIYAIFSAGASTLELQGDGSYTLGIKEERTINAFDFYWELVNRSGSAYYMNNGINNARPYFKNGAFAYFDDNVKCASEYNKKLNFGIVPWPKYDSETESYQSLVGSGTNVITVLKNTTVENQERISDILEGMAYYGYKDVVPYYFDTIISYQAVQDEHSLAMLQIIRQTLHHDLGHYANFGGCGNIGKDVMEGTEGFGNTLTTAIQAIETKVLLDTAVWSKAVIEQEN